MFQVKKVKLVLYRIAGYWLLHSGETVWACEQQHFNR